MNKKILVGMIAFCLLLSISLASAEVYFWNEVKIRNDSNSVSHYGYFQFYDDIEALTGLDQILLDLKKTLYAGRHVDLILRGIVENMPFDTGNYTVDYCEWNITHIQMEYDNEGNLISSTEVLHEFIYITNVTNETTIHLELKNRDSLIYDLRCYYNDSNFLYDESILFGRVATFYQANKCNDCKEFTIEELSNEIERTDEILIEELTIYGVIQNVVGFNFQIWLIISWFIKILFLLVAVGLIFMSVYYFYRFLKDVESRI